jgi:hypothetical protein
MQLALTNVGQTTFGKAKDEEMVRDTVNEEVAISEEARSNQHSAISEEQHQEQRPFTAKDAEDAEEDQGLPLMNTDDADRNGLPRMDADDRGLESGFKPVEWSPTPDMYRTDTPEGREAYEACLRRTMAPRPGADRRPPQPVIGPEDGAETHAVLG